MATLPALRLNGDISVTGNLRRWDRAAGVWTDAAAGVYNDTLQTVGTIADGDTGIGLAAGTNTSDTNDFAFDDMPADFADAGMLTLSIHYDAFGDNYVDDNNSFIGVQFFDSTGATAYTGQLQIIRFTTAGGYAPAQTVQDQTTAFTISPTGLNATRAQWNDALCRMVFNDNRVKGNDAGFLIAVDLEFTGTYTATAAPVMPRPRSLILPHNSHAIRHRESGLIR